MVLKSDRDGTCYDCGTTWKKGDEIESNGHKTKAGKDYWCKNGKNCQGVQSFSTTNEPTHTPITNNTASVPSDPKTKDMLIEAAHHIENENLQQIYKQAYKEAWNMIVRKAAIEDVMDLARIKHPARISFIHDVVERLK